MNIPYRFIPAIIVFLLSFQISAKSLYSTVFNVMRSLRSDKILVLSAADGRVYRYENSEDNFLYLHSLIGKVVKIDFIEEDGKLDIEKIQLANPTEINKSSMDLDHFQYNELRTFAPTDLKDLRIAKEVFDGLFNDNDKSISQCYKRAHMWAYDMWSQMGIFSEKVFLFYTRRYIELEEFNWWFHVAPLVTVNKELFVLDGTFMSRPIPLIDWRNYFIRTKKITCPIIQNYQEFSKNQWTRLCYLMTVPMYYYDPMSIEERDSQGALRNHWIMEELQLARRAFSNWMQRYEALETVKIKLGTNNEN